MTGYVRPKRQAVVGTAMRDLTWNDLELKNLDGIILRQWIPDTLWVEALGFDVMETGLYILTDGVDTYFTAPAIDLDFEDAIPEDEAHLGQQTTNGDNMKTETTSRPAGFMRMQETVVIRYPSVKWLSGQELTDTEKGFLATGQWDSVVVATCNHGYKVIDVQGQYLAVIASEDCI